MIKAAHFAGAVAFAAVLAAAPRAHAFTFHDAPAFAQRVAQLYIYLEQYAKIITAAQDHLAAFKKTYEGIKDWKNLGWVDALNLVDSPWFDNVDGIDDVRGIKFMASMSAQRIQEIWEGADNLSKLKNSRRYRTDPWYRMKVDSLLRQSKRARQQRAALIRQAQKQNEALTADVQHIKRLRDEIEKANKESPVNQAKVQALQAELSAVQAKYQGQDLMLKNQQAILFLVGEEEAKRTWLEYSDPTWMRNNNRSLREIGRAIAR